MQSWKPGSVVPSSNNMEKEYWKAKEQSEVVAEGVEEEDDEDNVEPQAMLVGSGQGTVTTEGPSRVFPNSVAIGLARLGGGLQGKAMSSSSQALLLVSGKLPVSFLEPFPPVEQVEA